MNRTLTPKHFEIFSHSASHVFSHFHWVAKVRGDQGQIETDDPHREIYKATIENIILAGFLLNIRFLDEFFSGKSNRKDDVRAKHFGYNFTGDILTKNERDGINKKLAHPTTKEKLFGPDGCNPYEMTSRALHPIFEFIDYVLKHEFKGDQKYQEQILSMRDTFESFWNDYTESISEVDKRINLNLSRKC